MAGRVSVWQPTPTTVDVTVTKIAGYVRVRILMNRWFFHIFGIHTFYARATLLNIWICMQWTDAADCGWGGGLDFAPMHAIRSVGQCDINIPSLSPRGRRSKAIANDYRHGCGLWTLVYLIRVGHVQEDMLERRFLARVRLTFWGNLYKVKKVTWLTLSWFVHLFVCLSVLRFL